VKSLLVFLHHFQREDDLSLGEKSRLTVRQLGCQGHRPGVILIASDEPQGPLYSLGLAEDKMAAISCLSQLLQLLLLLRPDCAVLSDSRVVMRYGTGSNNKATLLQKT
jgi:hypothetical protein